MPNDILDASQKIIDDAAQKTGIPTAPSSLPPEPEPLPVATETPSTTPPPATPEPLPPTSAPTQAPPNPTVVLPDTTPAAPDASGLVESLLETKNPLPVVPASPPSHTKLPAKKKSSKGIMLGLVALLLLILPVSVYFISQQNQQLADVRSRASGNTYATACQSGNDQACIDLCGEQPSAIQNTCVPPGVGCGTAGGTACTDWHWTNCIGGGTNGVGCGTGGGGGGGDDDDNGPNPTATPTPVITTPVCQNIKIYKGGTHVTDLTTLRAGDAVVLAVKGNLTPTKAHFRVNGGTWTETTTENSSHEWTLSYTMPDGITEFVIEGEVFTNGAWR